jgi:hypothetical protein
MPIIQLGHSEPGVITTVHMPDSYTLQEQVRTVTHEDDATVGVWRAHSAAGAPSWVDGDDAKLVEALAKEYNCPIGNPAEKE